LSTEVGGRARLSAAFGAGTGQSLAAGAAELRPLGIFRMAACAAHRGYPVTIYDQASL
jgi:hypothetical protein